MLSQDKLRLVMETEEIETVGDAFGGIVARLRPSYSVPKVRDWILAAAPFGGTSPIEQALRRAHTMFSKPALTIVVAGLVRFSFLIELTNLKVGSTKMKTRWLPGNILMPQLGSFEPVQGTFAPNSDPRAATFDECVGIFVKSCNMVCDGIAKDPSVKALIHDLNKLRRIPYEFPLSYVDASRDPVHRTANVCWIVNDDLRWLLKARRILRNATRDVMTGIRKVERSKLEVKVFKTDRALTGKDKTNRAKRWEVLDGDFQHAPLEKCWSAERKLITDLVDFQDFPTTLKGSFIRETLIQPDTSPTLCPVTFEPLVYDDLVESILNPTHGRSQYQVGHLHPLKQEGKHDGANVCWQSADGNRIQGDLTVDETHRLLDQIAERRAKSTTAS